MKTVLLYGGAFDPPHNGHIHLLRSAIDAVQSDQVIVMPTGLSPHKAGSLTPARVRLRMCRCFLAVDSRVTVSDHEIRQRGKSYTVNTVTWLRQKQPGTRIVLLMGSDMLLSFEHWYEWRRLLAMATLCCMVRNDAEKLALENKAAALRALGGSVILCPADAVEVSSTQIREAVAHGGDVSALLPRETLELIRRKDLYHGLPAVSSVRRAVKKQLSRTRWRHTLGVRRAAVEMARRYGADVKKAELAALLHDFLKEISKTEMLQIFADHAIMENTVRQRVPAAWHGMAAALVVRQRFGVQDEEILSAIDCHTCGKAGMSKLDKILYLADMISAERDFDGVDELRVLCRQDLDVAMLWALRHTVDYVTAGGKMLDQLSLDALHDMEKTMDDQEHP